MDPSMMVVSLLKLLCKYKTPKMEITFTVEVIQDKEKLKV
jgi:hypothetical protein